MGLLEYSWYVQGVMMTCALSLYILVLAAMQKRLSFILTYSGPNMTFPGTVENLHTHPQRKCDGTVVDNSSPLRCAGRHLSSPKC